MSDILARFSLRERIALVTGASSGIGRHAVLVLAQAGARVIAVARREEQLQDTCQAVLERGGEADYVIADLLHDDAIESLATQCRSAFGAPDILVNAAGVNFREPPEQVSRHTWDATLTLNLTVPFFLARALVPGMKRYGRGKIINIASLQTVRAFANGIAYGASKGGVGQLTRAMAQAWSSSGICANAIAPGFFPTPLTGPVFADHDAAARLAAQTAVGRNGIMDDLSGALVFLAAPASDYITGQVLFVDGGFSAK